MNSMDNFISISSADLEAINGGGIWGQIGGTLITVGGVIATGVNPVSVAIGIVALGDIWVY